MTKTQRAWYEIRNAADPNTAEVYIYDEIGSGFFTEGVTAKNFVNELNAITSPQIDLHLNSPGGSVFDGVAIFNALKRHPANVTTYIDGLAASIASVIALAGDRVVMAENALFMIHNPWGGVQGDAADMRKMADVLDKIKETLVSTYADKSGMSSEELNAALDAETWYTSTEALAAGFVDEIGAELRAAASFDFKALGFRHVPANLAEIVNDVDESAHPVTARQRALHSAFKDVAETFGKFNQGTGPDGAHYVDGESNPFKAEGMSCANCTLYEGPRACEIVEGDIDPEAVCKFWIVPADLMSNAEQVLPGEEPTPDSATGGSPAAATSDGASDETPQETEPAADAYFVPGVGFIDPGKEV